MADPNNPQTAKRIADGKSLGGHPCKYDSPEALQEAVDAYFVKAKEGEEVPTACGLALGLGYADRQSLTDLKEMSSEFSFVIRKAYTRLAKIREEGLYIKGRPTGDIFWLKNHGWIDEKHLAHSGQINTNPEPTEAEWEEFERRRSESRG